MSVGVLFDVILAGDDIPRIEDSLAFEGIIEIVEGFPQGNENLGFGGTFVSSGCRKSAIANPRVGKILSIFL